MKLLILLGVLISLNVQAASKNSLEMAKQGCAEFVTKLKQNPNISFGIAQVPKNWADPQEGTLPVFWWKRPGKDNTYPPLVFLHGGVAAQSWAALDRWDSIIKNYPGDFISFDHRGEGCSKTISSNENPQAYKAYRVRNVVKDLEFFRKNIFKYPKWRVMGHSRGAAIVQYYLEMAPYALESAHAMGFALMPKDLQRNYTIIRAQGFYEVAQKYLAVYPGDEDLVKKIKTQIPASTCWEGIDGRKLCGPDVVDILANTYVRNHDSWEALHKLLPTMTDFKSIYEILDAQIVKGIYGHFNYIAATNGQDFSNPDLYFTNALKSSALYNPFLSEIKFVGSVIGPTVKFNWAGSVDPLDFVKVKINLAKYKTKYFLYRGAFDPVAPFSMYDAQRILFGSGVNLITLPNSGHEGWYSPEVLTNMMRKSYQ